LKNKDIIIGGNYILASGRRSRMGCSKDFFKKLINTKVNVIDKLNNFNNKNTVQIQGIIENNTRFELITLWCSPYDLKELS